jgi:hypothetical protein
VLSLGPVHTTNAIVAGTVATLLSLAALSDDRFRIATAAVGGWVAPSPFIFSSTIAPGVCRGRAAVRRQGGVRELAMPATPVDGTPAIGGDGRLSLGLLLGFEPPIGSNRLLVLGTSGGLMVQLRAHGLAPARERRDS